MPLVTFSPPPFCAVLSWTRSPSKYWAVALCFASLIGVVKNMAANMAANAPLDGGEESGGLGGGEESGGLGADVGETSKVCQKIKKNVVL